MTTENAQSVAAAFLTQPRDTTTLDPSSLERLIISTRTVDRQVVVVSRYRDNLWHLVGRPTNTSPAERLIDFETVSPHWRAVLKAIIYRYMRRGREHEKRPSDAAVIKLFRDARLFLKYLDGAGIERLADVTPSVCSTYVTYCKQFRRESPGLKDGKPYRAGYLAHRFAAVEALHELSQHTADAMPAHPWIGMSARHLAGLGGSDHLDSDTPLMPDDVFSKLFQQAWEIVESADDLLDIHEELWAVRKASGSGGEFSHWKWSERRFIRSRGWVPREFREALLAVRTACYIVVASLSGCRNHELMFVETGSCYSTRAYDEQNQSFRVCWWMRSQSTKTGEGRTEWMIPEAAVKALRVMERWAKPYQAAINAEIEGRRSVNPLDPEIAEIQRHRHAIFLASTPLKENQVRTMSGQAMNNSLKAFAEKYGLHWSLATHHFRRKFANYVARSQFGDLRYLRSHFKHWSMDMTLCYALNESQELALYGDIQDELDNLKTGAVESWLAPNSRLAGGYGTSIVSWRVGPGITMFKDHKQMVRALVDSTPIRSNGHAFCTAPDDLCVGNDLERTRCADCNNSVIDESYIPLYRGLYDHLNEVSRLDDIGDAGQQLVQRDMSRCRTVLTALGDSSF